MTGILTMTERYMNDKQGKVSEVVDELVAELNNEPVQEEQPEDKEKDLVVSTYIETHTNDEGEEHEVTVRVFKPQPDPNEGTNPAWLHIT